MISPKTSVTQNSGFYCFFNFLALVTCVANNATVDSCWWHSSADLVYISLQSIIVAEGCECLSRSVCPFCQKGHSKITSRSDGGELWLSVMWHRGRGDRSVVTLTKWPIFEIVKICENAHLLILFTLYVYASMDILSTATSTEPPVPMFNVSEHLASPKLTTDNLSTYIITGPHTHSVGAD